LGHHRRVLIDDDGVPSFDLQSHSTRSDGALEPAEVVAHAARAGVRLLALTDHDTVDGIDEAQAAGAEHGVTIVPAVEVSTVDELGEDLHVLGYGFDHTDAGLAAALARWRADRAARIDRMADQLTLLGLPPDPTEIEARRAAGLPVGRPHLANAVIEAHGERLRADGLDECSAFLEAYLCKGRPAYSRRTTPTVPEAIDAIHAAGGVAVWAHPFWDLAGDDDVIGRPRALRGGGPGRRRGVLRHARRRPDATALRLSRAAGSPDDGIGRLPRPQHSRFSRFRAFELHGCAPRLGPIAAVG
jgi:predicted metal-dependent phosphoesterase TrpH